MKNYNAHKQHGAVLVIALVMLLVITVLAVSSMRGVTLESRITANRVQSQHLQDLADAALREGELRFYGPAYLREKLSPNKANCSKNNQLNRHGHNKPCLLDEMSDEADLLKYFTQPISFFKTAESDYAKQYANKTGAKTAEANSDAVVAWMPYRGLDAKKDHYIQPVDGKNAYWNSYLIPSNLCYINPESGDALEGRGTYCFLVTGQANDEIATQSTITATYLGLNN